MNVKQRSWFSWWGAALLLYLLLLGSSHVCQLLNPYVAQPDDDQQTVRVQAVAGDSLLPDRMVTIAYLDKYAGSAPNPPVILLLHGSPIATPMFSKLISELSDKFRVIAPDFPGYDGSSREVPSYSINSYSLYIKQLMDLLKVDNAHVVGYSLGGGVGINMAHKYPDYVQSLDLLSSIGVQELELLGSYQLNHVIHGAQLSFIWMFHNGIPHFGYFNDFLLNIPYAKSFYESDQRPLRSYLRGFQKPMLIQHGTGDELVPLAAAKEHHRIVPQSSLKLYSGGHGAVQSNHHAIAEDLSAFVKSVENENALPASQASSVRIEQAQKPFDDINFEKFKGLALIIMMLVIVLGTLISEDLTCIGAGLMAARGLIGFWPAVAACFLGIFLGDILLYLAGRWFGKAAVRRAPFKWILSKKDLERSSEWFKAKGPAIIIASRFLPGSRMPTYFSAGAIGASFWMFTGYFLIACIIWTPLLVGISTLVGAELLSYFAAYQEYALLFLLGIILFMIFITKVILPLLSYRGRRLMLSRWLRLSRWEFWSPYILYAPVCVYIAFLGIKHRQLTLFTAANPGIIHGGFIGESKAKILDKFKSSGCVATYQFLPANLSDEERISEAENFMQRYDLAFPVVVKPDVGQRGAGVKIIKNELDLNQVLNDVANELIIQEYIAGREYGVFYYHLPGEDKGHILSITDKNLLTLSGDGKSTLEELILKDEQTLNLAKKHFDHHKDNLYETPAEGENIRLVELGTHARGAVFSDGSAHITPELRKRMDKISNTAEGFYLGRFDIRTTSKETLKAGTNLHIIEVNGVTSEDTSIYDIENSFWDAQKALMRQWKIAYSIGAANARRGAKVSSVKDIIGVLVNYKKH